MFCLFLVLVASDTPVFLGYWCLDNVNAPNDCKFVSLSQPKKYLVKIIIRCKMKLLLVTTYKPNFGACEWASMSGWMA